jgi:hypothetical protein
VRWQNFDVKFSTGRADRVLSVTQLELDCALELASRSAIVHFNASVKLASGITGQPE